MKRTITAILVFVVAAALLVLPAMAAGSSSIQLSSESCVAGDTLEVTYSVAGYAQVESMGIFFEVPEGLELTSAEWLLEGDVKDVNNTDRRAVWTSEKAVNLATETAVFKLTYQVLEPAAAGDIEIGVSAIVKKGEEELGTPAAKAKIAVLIPATEISLSKDSVALDLNGTKTATLTATVAPANTTDKLTWACDDSGVVKISQDGTVTALKKGTAKVTATAGGISKTCTVTVTCSHDLEETKAKAPTCKTTGNQQYFTCQICGVVLASDKKTETTVADQILEVVDHSGGEATCSSLAKCEMCGKTYGGLLPHAYGEDWTGDETHHWHVCTLCQSAKAGKAEHSFQWVTDQEATEEAAGVKHEQCKCGAKRNEGTVIPKLEHTHVDIQHHKAVAATCVKAGNVEYWTCGGKDCKGKFYADKACTKELETVTVAIDPDNHNLSWVTDLEPTEDAEGKKHQVCSRCEAKFNENTPIEKLQHAPVLVEGVAPTCTDSGVAEHYFCQVCGRYYASVEGQIGDEITPEDTVLSATGHIHGEQWTSDEKNHWRECDCGDIADLAEHQAQVVGAVEATETEEGYTGDTVCSVCGYVIATGQTIPSLGTEETEPSTPPTQPSQTEPSQPAPSQTEPADDDGDKGGMPWILLVLILALVAVCAAIVVLVLKKNKNKE